jgi:Transglycosylase SLT domain
LVSSDKRLFIKENSMSRLVVGLSCALVASAITATANDAINFWQTNGAQKTAFAAPLDIRTDKTKRRDANLVATVYASADRFGVPRHIAHYHVDRESGWNVTAKNPASTATGLFQMIRGSHAEIIGKPLTRQEHASLARKPEHNANVGMAHIRACMDAMPGASEHALWKKCHYYGHSNVGTSIKVARAHYQRVVERSYPITVSAYAPPQGQFGVSMMPAAFMPNNYGAMQ